MTKELKYTIRPNPKNEGHYRLKSPKNEKFNFYRRDYNEWGLTIGGNCGYIELTQSEKLEQKFNINYLTSSKVNNLKFNLKGISKVSITGDYLEGKGNINWCWKYSSLDSETMILIDNNNSSQKIAKIEGFTLEAKNRGTIEMDSSIPVDFRSGIIATTCLVWMIKEDDVPDYITRKSERKRLSLGLKKYLTFLTHSHRRVFSIGSSYVA